MSSSQRTKFNSSQAWQDFISSAKPGSLNGSALLALRKACYEEIEAKRERPLLVYATKFLDPMPPAEAAMMPNSIDLSDIDGFTDLVNSISNTEERVDILLHSPGGRADATERIVGILRNKFRDITFLIPHSAYSAATMLALSGNNILLHSSATIGPIDPQINGIPTRSILRGFEKVKEIIAKEGPEALPAYIPLIEKYSIELLELCEDSEKLSKELVSTWLKRYMFGGQKNVGSKVKKAVDYFSDYDKHLLHSRPLLLQKIKNLNLKIELADDGLHELLWEAYILINGFFSVTHFVKLYETTHGVSWGRKFQKQLIQVKQAPQKAIVPK